ncbi:MAG: hypothetical protein FJ271_12470 [Planctomycetes bacterium]|nr:hypothetical protein [Planctomycetota bacterium]
MDWFLPGVPPTYKPVDINLVVVVQFDSWNNVTIDRVVGYVMGSHLGGFAEGVYVGIWTNPGRILDESWTNPLNRWKRSTWSSPERRAGVADLSSRDLS